MVTGALLYPAWGELMHSLRTGEPSFERVFGESQFAYLGTHPNAGAWFQQMMAHSKVAINAAVPAAYDFSECKIIVDVGGGNGSLLASVLAANPSARGVLFELPQVVDQARRQLTEAGVAERCDLVGGDFFVSLPTGDTYLMRSILHGHDDEQSARILQACRAAMPPDGRLLVIEQVIGGEDEPGAWMPEFMDLQMLIVQGGQERTSVEFRALFASGGFQLQRVIPTHSPASILEARPA